MGGRMQMHRTRQSGERGELSSRAPSTAKPLTFRQDYGVRIARGVERRHDTVALERCRLQDLMSGQTVLDVFGCIEGEAGAFHQQAHVLHFLVGPEGTVEQV